MAGQRDLRFVLGIGGVKLCVNDLPPLGIWLCNKIVKIEAKTPIEGTRHINVMDGFYLIVDEVAVEGVGSVGTRTKIQTRKDGHEGQGRHSKKQFRTKFKVCEQAHR